MLPQMSMKPFLLFVMLAGGTYGLFQVPDTDCDATQNTSLCSPVLGGSVSIKLMNNATGYKLKCYKNITNDRVIVFYLKKGAVTIEGPYQKRAEFFINTGTLKITNVMKNDTGQYNVTVHDADGKYEKDISFILQVKGPGLVLCSLLFVVTILSCGGIALCFKWKETKYKKEPSAPQRKELVEDCSVTELRSVA